MGSEHPVTLPRALGPALRLGCDVHPPVPLLAPPPPVSLPMHTDRHSLCGAARPHLRLGMACTAPSASRLLPQPGWATGGALTASLDTQGDRGCEEGPEEPKSDKSPWQPKRRAAGGQGQPQPSWVSWMSDSSGYEIRN